MTLAISVDHNEARLAATVAFADSGPLASRIFLYHTVRPDFGADPGAAPLAVLSLAKPCGVVANGVLSLVQGDGYGDLVLATGQAVWARWVNGFDALVADGSVSDDAGSGDFKISGTVGGLLFAGAYVVLGPGSLG